ncbi:MAG: hypothetical protein GXY82_06660 [Methanospirillum sp.]|nr:hypothetical protein [Methanospirillum sp.]
MALGMEEPGVVGAIDQLPVPAYLLALNGTVLAWNPPIARLTGTAAENVVGRGNGAHALPFIGRDGPMLADLVLSRREGVVPRHLSGVQQDGAGLSAVLEADALGAGRTFGVRAKPMTRGSTVIGAVEVLTEEPVRGSDIPSAGAALPRVLGTVRHDIRNELMIVQGYIEIARDSVNDPSISAGLGRALSAAGEIETLVEYSRALQELGGRLPELRDLSLLVRDAAASVELRGIDLDLDHLRGTLGADPAVFVILESLFEVLFCLSASVAPRPSGMRVSVREAGDSVVYEEEKALSGESVGRRPCSVRNPWRRLALLREILLLDGIGLEFTRDPLRLELRFPAGRLVSEKK